MQDDLGDRMQEFESAEASRRLMPLLPICIRLDGRSFSRYTAKMDKPYDVLMSSIMVNVTKLLVEETNAAMGYTQSDEISLVLRQPSYESQVYFDGKIQKINSVLAGFASSCFNRMTETVFSEAITESLALFDCRVWNVPNEMEAANTLVWRQKDALRNAVQGAARSVFSHKECQDKNNVELVYMLKNKGIIFNDYPDFFKQGTFVRRVKKLIDLTPEQMEKIPEKHRPTGPVERTVIEEVKIEDFGLAQNKVEVVFEGKTPTYITVKDP